MPVRNHRRRYLAIRVYSDHSHSEEELANAIEEKIRFLYGVKGSSDTRFRMIEYSREEGRGIVRCSHDMLTEMRATLAHVSAIGDKPASIQVLRVSGTIKSLRRKTAQSPAPERRL